MAPSRVAATVSSCSSPASSSSLLHLRLPKPPIPASLSGVVVVLASATSPNGTVLERRRPARLDIPVSSLAFGIPPIPSATAPRDVVEEERDAFSIYCKRRRREHMEDLYSAADNLCGQQKLAFFGIFDGHGGAKAAKFVANKLEKNVLDEVILSEEDSIEELW
ncbi:probable protein phosphatase 2C 25 isoform X2 [Arachis hypogaea]|uniref:probable protein phosphatase 2C 25 isoform X2 n=1 Tax=Arachis hypogaea TaxID=3818 RepID=UPI003B221530|nr:putative protein phosphatase 2C [Arachis hypogaea]